MPSKQVNAWLVHGLTYEQRIILAASDLITNFQVDHRSKSVRFWPPSPGVLTYLKANLPEGCTIEGEELQPKVEKAKMPPIVHRTGMSISDD
jgi:hypothetical protein